MTEETPQSHENPSEDASYPPVGGTEVPPPPGQPQGFEPAPSEPAPSEPAPSEPARTLSQESSFPSPEEDAALREERAKRFGGASSETTVHMPAGEEPAAEAPEPAASHVTTPIPAAPTIRLPQAPPPPEAPVTTAPPQAPVQHDFDGFEEAPASRAAAHWWSILISLVFAPLAWYLFTDGGFRLELALSQGEAPAVAVLAEFSFGAVALFIYLLAARWSSVGTIIMGALTLALGIAFLSFPADSSALLGESIQYFGRLGQFGLNVVEHLSSSLETGRLIVYGLTMVMVGVVSHGARRQGRREERTKIALGE